MMVPRWEESLGLGKKSERIREYKLTVTKQ